MKKWMKKMIAIILTTTMTLSAFSPAFADIQEAQNQLDEYTQAEIQAIEDITTIEKRLEQNGYTILEGLEMGKEQFEFLASQAKTENDREKFNALVQGYENMINEYILYQNGIQPYGVEHPVLSVAVASAVSAFSVAKCWLSAELLTYAKEKASYNETYTPGMIDNIYSTSEYSRMKTEGIFSGTRSGCFAGTINTYPEKDCFFAIHLFNYTKKNNLITITDRYDFDLDKDTSYANFVGLAVNTMLTAQELGVIVPYYVNIPL